MLDRLRRMLGMPPPQSDGATEAKHEGQERVQREQFDVWADTKQEVERVQAIAEGRAVPVKRRRTPAHR